MPQINGNYEPTIGLELHVQLKTRVKLFSSAETSYEAVPNTHLQPFDAGLPGALPVGSQIRAVSFRTEVHLAGYQL